MRSDLRFPVLTLGTVAIFALAQDPPAPKPAPAPPAKPTPTTVPPANAQTRYYAEQFRRLHGEIDELKDAHSQQTTETTKLRAQIKILSENSAELNRKLAGKFATAEDLEALRVALKELDANRIQDRDELTAAIGKLGKLIEKVAKQKSAESVEPTHRAVAQDFKYNEHKVKADQFLSTIIVAFNRAYKEEGLGTVTQSQVLKANPGLDPNKLRVGQTIKIPLPGEIK